MPSFACHALSLSLSPLSLSSLLSPSFSAERCVSPQSVTARGPLSNADTGTGGKATNTSSTAAATDWLPRADFELRQSESCSARKCQNTCAVGVCCFCCNKSHTDSKIKHPIHKCCEFIYLTCHEEKINNALILL